MDYENGYKAGKNDAKLISYPINTNGYTYNEYQRINHLYHFAINPFRSSYSDIPKGWLDGYAQGFDDWCIENGFDKEVD